MHGRKLEPGDKVIHGHSSKGPILEVIGEHRGTFGPDKVYHVQYPDGTLSCYFHSQLWPAKKES